jgi:hypothetical protein
MTTDDGMFGSSLDGVIDDDGSAEYKCFISPLKLRQIMIFGSLHTVMDQCQGGLWISGRKWMDFCLFCPALTPLGKQLWVKRVYRDDDYIEALERDLYTFKGLIDSYEAVLRMEGTSADFEQQPNSIIEKATRRVRPMATTIPRLTPKPLPGPIVALPRFEALQARVAAAKNRIACDLILDGADDLPTSERETLARQVNERFPAHAGAGA